MHRPLLTPVSWPGNLLFRTIKFSLFPAKTTVFNTIIAALLSKEFSRVSTAPPDRHEKLPHVKKRKINLLTWVSGSGGIERLSEVKAVVLESDGHLSVIRYGEETALHHSRTSPDSISSATH
jgi:hypothetical protein